MNFTEQEIDFLREEIEKRLSKQRFCHTLGVEKMAVKIGEKCMPDKLDKLRVAALLHDVSKEYSEAEHFEVVEKHKISLTDEDIASPALWHSLTAAAVVSDEFSDFADEEILSAVYNHTVGSPDMSLFDEIILLSDYIEEGRTYQMCIDVRRDFLRDLEEAKNDREYALAIHNAVVSALNNTINEFLSRGKSYHERTRSTRDAIVKKIER